MVYFEIINSQGILGSVTYIIIVTHVPGRHELSQVKNNCCRRFWKECPQSVGHPGNNLSNRCKWFVRFISGLTMIKILKLSGKKWETV